jgi:hypothetical protein
MASSPITVAPAQFLVTTVITTKPSEPGGDTKTYTTVIGIAESDSEADAVAADYIAKNEGARVAIYSPMRVFAETRKVEPVWTARR